jgi:hypothetical protein
MGILSEFIELSDVASPVLEPSDVASVVLELLRRSAGGGCRNGKCGAESDGRT